MSQEFEFWNRPRSFLQFLRQLFAARWRSLLALALGVCLPLLVFEQLALVVWRDQGGFLWDVPLLEAIHATTRPGLDRFAATLTKFGVFRGVFPVATVVSIWLLYQRRWRSLAYWAITLSGSIVINRTAKAYWHRLRPSLWNSVAPESDFSFPSGHAMSSMTLVAALVILTWGTRWSGIIAIFGSIFVVAIGWTRLYLGVHFPSDILAGWLVALAWAIGVGLILRPHWTPQRDEAVAASEETTLLPEEVQAVQNELR
jgi:undecaprenyl-diphosphatase